MTAKFGFFRDQSLSIPRENKEYFFDRVSEFLDKGGDILGGQSIYLNSKKRKIIPRNYFQFKSSSMCHQTWEIQIKRNFPIKNRSSTTTSATMRIANVCSWHDFNHLNMSLMSPKFYLVKNRLSFSTNKKEPILFTEMIFVQYFFLAITILN